MTDYYQRGEAREFVQPTLAHLISLVHGPDWYNFEHDLDFVCDTFEIHPYLWDPECDCGHDDEADAWEVAHDHKDSCYQNELGRRFAAAGLTEWGRIPEGEEKNEDGEYLFAVVENEAGFLVSTSDYIIRTLCEEMDLDPEFGCMVHCTCGPREEWAAWSKEHTHADRCPIDLPNFWYKPTDLRVQWYKHVARGVSSNRELDLVEWTSIMSDCYQAVLDVIASEAIELTIQPKETPA